MKFLVASLALVGVLVAGLAAIGSGTPSTVARDGKTLASQPQEVQDQFNATWGEQAATEWVKEHNADPTTPSHPATVPPTPKPITSSDAEISCAESVRQALEKQGTPSGGVDIDWGGTHATTLGDGKWQCSVKVTAPNIFGAKRTTTYSVAIENIRPTADGGSTWTLDSIYP